MWNTFLYFLIFLFLFTNTFHEHLYDTVERIVAPTCSAQISYRASVETRRYRNMPVWRARISRLAKRADIRKSVREGVRKEARKLVR